MALLEDKQWASRYLLDPLTAPEPADETGPGTSFTRPVERKSSPSSQKGSSKKPVLDEKKAPTSQTRSSDVKTSLPSRSRQERTNDFRVDYRQDAFGTDQPSGRRQRSVEPSSSPDAKQRTGHRRRTSSLSSRFPGDRSHQPLDIIKQDNLRANRSPHLRKGHIPGTDVIDNLDISPLGSAYHHEGPFDATLFARNSTPKYRPIDALRSSNAEAIRATPQSRIADSLEQHRPWDGVASIPSGERDFSGKRLEYEEGSDLMIEEGGYKRWPGVQYLPGDLKGKGEPSYSIEKALKEYKGHRRIVSDGNAAYEMVQPSGRPRSSGGNEPTATGVKDGTRMSYSEWEQDIKRSNSERRASGNGLRKRFSLRKKQQV